MQLSKINFRDYFKKHFERKKYHKTERKKINKELYLEKHGRLDFKYFKLRYPEQKIFIDARQFCSWLSRLPKLPLYLDFLRWELYDLFKADNDRHWGIYCFVGLPSQGKTISMVAQIQRIQKKRPDVLVATNFGYRYQDFAIRDWQDICIFASKCSMARRRCLVAIDEIHITWDATDYKHFPQELQSMLSQNRHLDLQFLCSSQRYDRIPSKIRGLANYVVVSRNVLDTDRLFINYYVECSHYEDNFTGKIRDADFLRQFVAGNDLRNSYDTKYMVSVMKQYDKEYESERDAALRRLLKLPEDDY